MGAGGGGDFVRPEADILRESSPAERHGGAWVCSGEAIDRLSGPPVRDTRAHLFDTAAGVEAEQQRQALGGEHGQQLTGARFRINRVHARSCDPDEDFPAPR